MLAMIPKTRLIELATTSLGIILAFYVVALKDCSYHVGSGISLTSMPMFVRISLLFTSHFHGWTNAQMLSAVAIVPNVPANKGNAVMANHSLLFNDQQ